MRHGIGLLRQVGLACAGAAMVLLSGCAADKGNLDPWEKTNRFFYNFDDGLDRVLLKPLSSAYVKVVPQAAETRARVETAVRIRDAAAIDPYILTRDAFLQYRDHLIYEGHKAV